MKLKIIFLLLIFSFAFFGCKDKGNKDNAQNGSSSKGNISISGAFALYPMCVKWVEEYKKIHPKVQIDVSAGGAGKGMADTLSGIVDIGMISRDIYEEEIAKGAYGMPVVKDAVVATINEKNPNINIILKKGLTRKNFKDLWLLDKVKTWNEILNIQGSDRISLYTRSDSCGAGETWAKYLGAKQEDLKGVGVYADPGLVEAVKKDSLGIGYNNINYAYDANSKKPAAGIRICPIDLNDNGMLDNDENFYETRDEIINAIVKDKYPTPPSKVLYFVTKGIPEKGIIRNFIKWSLTDGQKYVNECGYINIDQKIINFELDKLMK